MSYPEPAVNVWEVSFTVEPAISIFIDRVTVVEACACVFIQADMNIPYWALPVLSLGVFVRLKACAAVPYAALRAWEPLASSVLVEPSD